MIDDGLNVACIAECIARIEEYTSSGREVFEATRMIQDAVVRNFQVIGDATKNLSSEIKQAYPNVPWRRMAGFRDVLVHDYLRVDFNIVWEIIEMELPNLKPQILEILQILDSTSS
ncbi:HepT-like ribonuclease domain-containing protein [Leptolyngbya sp. AN03gr2]|uniref:HepT-like ribonuclease domain-containing protein n=1 Tax=unclassified Leptolyngbya TaxID=2650499 RepID=UPI003D31331D